MDIIAPEIDSSQNTPYIVSILIISVPIIFLAVVGNIFVILCWITFKPLRTPPNAYLISLALTDLLVGLFVLPMTVSNGLHNGWVHGYVGCRFWLTSYFSLSAVSAYHLVAIAVDRYRSVAEGATYIYRRTMRSTVETCVLIWLGGFWISGPLIVDWNKMTKDPSAEKQCITIKHNFWVAHVFVSSFFLPSYVIVRLYYKVFLEIRKRNNKRKTKLNYLGTPETSELSEAHVVSLGDKGAGKLKQAIGKITMARERKAAVTMGIVVILFVVCWLPWHILALYDVSVPPEWKPNPPFYMFMAVIGLANSCMNPILYAIRIKEFKDAMKGMFSWSKCKRSG